MDSMKRHFNVGDRCRIRQWDDMAAEFGLRYGAILCNGTFEKNMRYLCGEPFTIKTINYIPDLGYEWVTSVEGAEKTALWPRGYWAITFDMLEPYENESENLECATYDDLVSLW